MTNVLELLDRGRLYRGSGDPSTAARILSEAATAAPDDRAVLTELALAHFQASPPLRNSMRRLRPTEPCGYPVDCGWVPSRYP